MIRQVAASVIVLVSTLSVQGGVNLIQNGGFDDQPVPRPWATYGMGGGSRVDERVFRSAPRSGAVVIDETTWCRPTPELGLLRYGWWKQTVTLDPQKCYDLRAWVKADVHAGAVGFEIRFNGFREETTIEFHPLRETCDPWRQIAVTFRPVRHTGPVSTSITLIARDFLGTAWFDDVTLTETAADPTSALELIRGRLPQAWHTEDPLYRELMDADPLVAPDDHLGLFYIGWPPIGSDRDATWFGLRHGMAFHLDRFMGLYRDHRLALPVKVYLPGQGLDPERRNRMYQLITAQGLKMDVSQAPITAGRGGIFPTELPPNPPPRCSSFGYLPLDPQVLDMFIEHARKVHRHFKDIIWAAALGHETTEQIIWNYDEWRHAYRKQRPELWARWERELTTEFGSGRFGLPQSQQDADPFERIAFFQWFFDRYNNSLAQIARAIRAENPAVRITTDVRFAGVAPSGWEDVAGICDMINKQMSWGGGPHRQNVAFECKFYGDITGVPVCASPHVEHYMSVLTPEETNEVISSGFRVGAKYLALYPVDWFGNTYSDCYGAPERFQEMLHCYEQMSSMGRLRSPRPDTAIFYSNLSEYAAAGYDKQHRHWYHFRTQSPHEWCFTLLGPQARSWFNFVTDRQLSLGRDDLSQYKLLYIPQAEYQDDASVQRILAFVERGGTVVLASPMTFRWRPDGSERVNRCEDIMGIALGPEIALGDGIALKRGALEYLPGCGDSISAGVRLPLQSDYRQTAPRLLPLGDTIVLATFSDGTPALTLRRRGNGNILTFAATPFSTSSITSPAWATFFKGLQQSFGCATGHDIWRFRFPPSAKPFPDPPDPAGLVCLTGNAWRWLLEQPDPGPNVAVGARYRYSLPPDRIGENQPMPAQGLAFLDGRLGNRRASLDAQPVRQLGPEMDKELEPWLVAWNTLEPFAVRVTFDRLVNVAEVRLWAHGEIPAIEAGAVTPGGYLKQAEVHAHGPAGIDVREVRLRLDPAGHGDQFEIRFARRQQDPLYLGEVELWGTTP